jgi:hypothetical protein
MECKDKTQIFVSHKESVLHPTSILNSSSTSDGFNVINSYKHQLCKEIF